MGINEIRDNMETLLTERMERMRRVEKREGQAGGGRGGSGFQEVFEFVEKEQSEEEKKEAKHDKDELITTSVPENTGTELPPRVIRAEDIENAKKRDEVSPGQIIDIEI